MERVEAPVSIEPGPALRAPEAGDEGADGDVASGRGFRLQTFRSLRHRNYRLLWCSTLFSASGQWIEQVTVGWLTYELTGSAFLLGAVNGVRSLPLLLLAPFAGVAADRIDRKRMMLTSQASLMLLTALLATLIVTGQIRVWHLFLFPLLTGTGWAFNMPVRQSIVPNIVPKQDLLNALALNSAGFNLTRILGPTAGGVLIALIGAGENFYLQAAAYLGVVLMVSRVNIPPIVVAPKHSVLANFAEGAAFVWKHPTLRTQMSLALVPVIIAIPYVSLMPIFASDVLGQGPGGLGLMMGAPGIGAVLGSLVLASLRNVNRKGWVLLGAVFALGMVLMLFSLSRSFPLSLFLLIVAGAVQMVYMTMNQTVVQLTVPDQLRGRVMGIYLLNQGLVPLGSLIHGTLAGFLGAPTAVFLMGLLVSLLAVGFAIQARTIRGL